MPYSAEQEEFANECKEKLIPLGGIIREKKMMGGFMLFKDDTAFAAITKTNVLHFRTDKENEERYLENDSAKMHAKMPYYSVPEHVFQNNNQFLEWAEDAFQAALRNQK